MLLTYGFWQRRFAGDPSVVGRTLNLSDTPFTIIGVLPPSFQFAPVGSPDYWTTIIPQDYQIQRRNLHWLDTIARLKPGVSLERARAEMRGIAAQLEREYPDANARASVRVLPLAEEITGQTRPALYILLGAVALVLLIACVNVANLLLARVASREREMAVRAAMGAARTRLIRQLLAESVLLAVLGGTAGLLVALWGVNALVSAFPDAILRSMPYLMNVNVHGGVLAFNFLVAAAVGVLFGLAPALHGTRFGLHDSLKEGARATGSRAHSRLRSTLVVSEVALALTLLVTMGLTLRSLERVLARDPGFRLEHLAAVQVILPDKTYDGSPKTLHFWEELRERVNAIPSVVSSGTTTVLPLTGGGNTVRLYAQNKPAPAPGQEDEANIRDVNETYFTTLGVPLLRGRFFEPRDRKPEPRVVILNQTLATRLFGNEDPVGKSVVLTFNSSAWLVIGVVGDAELASLDAASNPAIYSYAYQQSGQTYADTFAVLVTRSSGDPAATLSAIREVAHALDPEVRLYKGRTIEEILASSTTVFFRKYLTSLLGGFALIALLLAAIGLYGVLSYGVTQRLHEFGIRMALGAQQQDIMRLVLRLGLVLALVGAGIGLVVSLAMGWAMRGVLFGVSGHDPVAFVLGVCALLLAALLACWIPAQRATRTDPMVALRYE